MRSNIWILLRICHLWWVLRKIRERWVKYKANGVLIEWLILMKVSCERRERRLILYVASNSLKSHWVRTFLWLKRPLHQIIIINAQSPFPNSLFFSSMLNLCLQCFHNIIMPVTLLFLVHINNVQPFCLNNYRSY